MSSEESSGRWNNAFLNEQRRLAARRYAERGWPVLPLSRHQRPVGELGVADATTELEKIDEWWSETPHANIAIATGRASGLVVLEAQVTRDLPGGGVYDPLLELREEYGPIPATRRAISCGDTTYDYYRHPYGFRIPTFFDLRWGLSIRSESELVVAPPSVDPSGCRYEWSDESRQVEPFPEKLIPEVSGMTIGGVPEGHVVRGMPESPWEKDR